MKTLLLALLLTSVHFSVKAQHYQSIFGKQSTSWVIAWNNLPGTTQSTIVVQKDTIVNGLAYKKVILQGVPVGTGYYDGGLLRQDTIAGKVWYKKLYPANPQFPFDTMEVLAFDYNLSVGDTFVILVDMVMQCWGGYPDSFNVVKRVYYQNNRKHIEFKGPAFEHFTMIEGIGGTFGVIWKEYDGPMLGHYLLCSYKDGVKTSYINNAFQGRCAITGILEDDPEEKIVVYPNPAQDRLFIKTVSGEKIGSCRVLSALGVVVLNPEVKAEQTIDIAVLRAGMYVLQFGFSNGEMLQQKFVKQ